MKRQSDDQALTTLMQAAQVGDAQAYVQLLKEITPRLRQIVRRQRCFVSTEDIEDLVQDILLSLHAVRASYDPQRPFMPWLMAITRNRLVDGARPGFARLGVGSVEALDLRLDQAGEVDALADLEVPAAQHLQDGDLHGVGGINRPGQHDEGGLDPSAGTFQL